MSDTGSMAFEVERHHKRLKISVRLANELVHSDILDPASQHARRRFVKGLCEKIPAADRDEIERELIRFSDTTGHETSDPDAGPDAEEALARIPQDIRDEAESLLEDPYLIRHVIDDVALLGVAGEKELTASVYMIGVSRLLDKPLAGIIQGPSSSGKSYLIERTAALFPPQAVIHATQMSPQALFHMKPGYLSHRFIVAGERSRSEDDDRAEATRALREMLSAGRLTKLMPTKVPGGEIQTVLIEQDGPVAFVESTTLAKVFDEDANRCIMMHTDERPQQTRRIVDSIASALSGETRHDVERTIQRHHALQLMLDRSPVVIPYAVRLAESIAVARVEVRRAFSHLTSMIQAVALLYQRQLKRDADGRLIAEASDYQISSRLLSGPMARLLGNQLSDPARRFYDRMRKWADGTFTSAEAKTHETGSRSSVYGWLGELHESGLLELVDAPRGRMPATWKLTDRIPDDVAGTVLPSLEALFPESERKHGRESQRII